MLLPVPGAVESLIILLLALVLDACIGDVRLLDRLLPRPADLAARAAGWCDRRLNRIDRADATRRARGALTVAALALGAVATGLAVMVVTRTAPGGWLVEMVLVARCLDVRRPWAGLWAVGAALERGGLEAGRQAVAPLTDRQAWTLDFHGVVRAGVEHAARGLLRGVLAPLLLFVLLGLPGVLLWAVALGGRRAIGHTALPRYQAFGRAAAVLYRGLGLPAAWLSAPLVAASALFVPGGRAVAAVATPLRSAPGHPQGVEAWPVAAIAGALDLALAGPRREGDTLVQEPWLGEGRARATGKDLRPALALYALVAVLSAALVLLIFILAL